jgi:alcohol dehydrogenase, propanol-preferring
VLATAPNANAISALIDGVGIDGRIMILAAVPEPLRVTGLQLLAGRRSVQGCLTGTAAESAEALRFCVDNGIRPVVEPFPLDRAADAYQRMILGKARFRAVIVL